MKKVLYYMEIYWLLQRQNIKALMEYRIDFLIMLFFTIFAQGCNLAVVNIIYINTPEVGGWKYGEVLLLYGFLLFSEGSINFFFQGMWKISQMINQAELDRFILRPLPIGLQIITARIDFDGLNKMTIGISVFLYGSSQCEIHWSAQKVIILIAVLVLSCLLRACMIWIASCTSFWLEGTKNQLNFFVSKLGDAAKYPLTIYPTFLQSIFICVVPYAFISYYPMGYVLEKQGTQRCVILLPIVLLIVFWIARIQLKAGLARYESCGN